MKFYFRGRDITDVRGSLHFEPCATNLAKPFTLRNLTLAQVEAIALEASDLARDMKHGDSAQNVAADKPKAPQS